MGDFALLGGGNVYLRDGAILLAQRIGLEQEREIEHKNG